MPERNQFGMPPPFFPPDAGPNAHVDVQGLPKRLQDLQPGRQTHIVSGVPLEVRPIGPSVILDLASQSVPIFAENAIVGADTYYGSGRDNLRFSAGYDAATKAYVVQPISPSIQRVMQVSKVRGAQHPVPHWRGIHPHEPLPPLFSSDVPLVQFVAQCGSDTYLGEVKFDDNHQPMNAHLLRVATVEGRTPWRVHLPGFYFADFEPAGRPIEKVIEPALDTNRSIYDPQYLNFNIGGFDVTCEFRDAHLSGQGTPYVNRMTTVTFHPANLANPGLMYQGVATDAHLSKGYVSEWEPVDQDSFTLVGNSVSAGRFVDESVYPGVLLDMDEITRRLKSIRPYVEQHRAIILLMGDRLVNGIVEPSSSICEIVTTRIIDNGRDVPPQLIHTKIQQLKEVEN